MIDEHTTETLEFSKVIALVSGKCLTRFGHEEVAQIAPLRGRELIERRLAEISEMKDVIQFGDAFPLYRMETDCRELLKRSEVEGNALDGKEILEVLELVIVSIGLNEYAADDREKYPLLSEYLEGTRAFPEMRTLINKAIDEEGYVRDNASPKLRTIRLDLADSRRKIVAKLETILTRRAKQAGWQDDVVTQRNDRYVIPVPSSLYQSDRGILHDRSQSGATLYVEPKETVELNNRINLLMQEEYAEVQRILRELTAEIGRRSASLIENTRMIGRLDRIHACGLVSHEIKGHGPEIVDEAEISLVEARHPLLIVQLADIKKVVPTDFSLGNGRQVVLVTGPNTGGKTIALKTIGLSLLMTLSGLHISAGEKSRIGLFDNLHADIGDEQSIELSLSTFASHVRNIISGLQAASSRTLLLFDEIGAGTDPKEGAALAEAIILYAVQKGACLVATTHYSQLKTLAMDHPEIENASLEFDRETLAPTYRLHLGLPGSSYAIEIAGRLGMPRSICERAAEFCGTSERSLADLIATIEKELATIKQDRKELTERLKEARALEISNRARSEQLQESGDSAIDDYLIETEQFLNDTRREVERLVADIRGSQASKESVQEFHRNLKKKQKQLLQRQRGPKEKPTPKAMVAVGDAVQVLSLDKNGEVVQLIGNDKAKVRLGNVTTTVPLRNLALLDSSGERTLESKHVGHAPNEDVSPEIHLRGMTVDEAMEALNRFLDRAVVAGLQQVYVIHGKGTGALRKGLTTFLKNHPEVASLRLGDWNEGGSGVTVVKLNT
ncbi:MAG: endonuclease MutS2 [candidate division Zixibacteria bacterium]|nr:endonuclease MutS2 [candidate division Zixibacteria bacterium]MDH3936936.1 endonuclease MutS2 [candidate division Zixibacteria bacterium]MDH4033920.1 endonuclease MutS2 [candidate division Zixibacteria bacterium]